MTSNALDDTIALCRIDAPGALHHVIVRGIEQSAIFYDNGDRDRLIDRIEKVFAEEKTKCYAFALLNGFRICRHGGNIMKSSVYFSFLFLVALLAIFCPGARSETVTFRSTETTFDGKPLMLEGELVKPSGDGPFPLSFFCIPVAEGPGPEKRLGRPVRKLGIRLPYSG